MDFKLGDIRKLLRINTNWFIASILGKDTLSQEELDELKKHSKLPKTELNLVERSFVLGRLKSYLKTAEYGKISYEGLVDKANEISLSPIERLAMDQAKLKAASNIKGIADDIAAGVYSELEKATKQVISEATVRKIINDETQLAVLRKQTYQELASSLASRLKTQYKKDWSLIAETELHAAKTQGTAQAILSGVDVYSGVGGPEARVSVIPKPTACEDCRAQYLDANGNPKIFSLGELISNGTNTEHKKRNGVHYLWKPVLPPLHPRCRCDLQYIPAGASWSNGRLVIDDQDAYQQSISKAIGDSKLSATAKPPGPASAQAQPGNPAMPGVDSPQGAAAKAAAGPQEKKTNVTRKRGGAAPAGGEGGAPRQDMVACPLGGGDACVAGGGSGSDYHEAGSAVLEKHREYMMRQHHERTPEEANQANAVEIAQSKDIANPHDKVLNHLKNGEIESIKVLGEEDNAGMTHSYKIKIAGNGDGAMKPSAFSGTDERSQYVAAGYMTASGVAACPFGTYAAREEAAYKAHMAFGLTDHVPPTTTRSHEGSTHSVQAWQDGFKQLLTDSWAANPKGVNGIKHALDKAPPDKREKLREKLSEGAVMAAVLNMNDQHLDNVMISENYDDVRFIDNSFSFGTGLSGCVSGIHCEMHDAHMKLQVPDKLMDRFESTTLSDLQRSLKGTVEDWAIGQTYLRMKYVMYLQKTEGHLDYEKFRAADLGTVNGEYMHPHTGYWPGPTQQDSIAEYNSRIEKGIHANQMFESFAKAWIRDAQKLPREHPDRIAAVELETLGVFMGPGMSKDPAAYRKSFRHLSYETDIVPRYPPQKVKTGMFSDTPAEEIGKYKKTAPTEPTTSLPPEAKRSSIELSDSDIEEVKPPEPPLSLDMSEFKDDLIDDVLDKLDDLDFTAGSFEKKSVKKGFPLFLSLDRSRSGFTL